MEGTRNERVVVLVISYLIGFVTAYIAFGVTQLHEKLVYIEVPVQTAAVINASIDANTALPVPAITKDGLVVVQNNEARVISAKMDEDGVLPEGYHVSIADYALSPDGKYVYFCETPTTALDVCRPYIYVVDEDAVYPVRQNGERVAFDTAEGAVYWDANGELVFE